MWHRLVMASNQLVNLVQMSKWETKKMRNPWKQKIPRVRMNPKNPTSREKEEREDSGHAVYKSWCAACVEGRGVGGQHRIELLEGEKRERTTPIVPFDYGFLTQENADTFPILICRDSRYGQTGATCCERKSPTAYSISFLAGFIKDLGFSQNHFENAMMNRARKHSKMR